MRFFDNDCLAVDVMPVQHLVQAVRSREGRVVAEESPKNAVPIGKLMVGADGEEVLVRYLPPGKGELSGVTIGILGTRGSVGPEGQILGGGWIHGNGRAIGHMTVPRVIGRDLNALSDPLQWPYPFIAAKNQCAVCLS